MQKFFDGVANGSAAIICDGSFKDDWGTASVIMMPYLESLEPVISVHVTPGNPDKHNPYRAELSGILASVISVEQESHLYGVASGTITIGCDCDSALKAFTDCITY